MAIGIFGGTFDPIHIGHLRVAEEIREVYRLGKIYIIPSSVPPHKTRKDITKPVLRMEMVKIAIRGNPFLKPSSIEIERSGVSYSIDTVKAIEKKDSDIYFIIGIDAFAEIDTWRNYQKLFEHTHFIVMVRPWEGISPGKDLLPPPVRANIVRAGKKVLQHRSGKKIYFHNVTQLDISSTRIRELVKRGLSIKYLVTPGVEKFITERGLYKN